jgi:flagellar basal-body rod modification protein FlgD
MSVGATNSAAAAATQVVNTPMTNAGATNGAPTREKDRTEAQTAPQFGEILQNVQAKYGAKPEKGREIKKTLGKDDFLRIMITQMKNQDPTNPFKAEQMATEMAQFTTVEQLNNMSASLTKMTTANQPLERLAMTNMIGKTLTVDRGRFPHVEGTNDVLSFGMPQDAHQVTVSVVNELGETVFQKELGKTKAGENSITWDGKKANLLPAKAGTYIIRVDAVDEKGQKLETNSQTQARVVGVSFEGSEPVFLVGDARHQEKITMKNVIRIDGDPGALGFTQASGAVPGAPSGAPTSALPAPKSAPAFFNFQKGVGSSNLDPSQAPPEMQQALASFHEAQAAPARTAQAAPPPSPEKGFPNGLHDDPPSGQNRVSAAPVSPGGIQRPKLSQ